MTKDELIALLPDGDVIHCFRRGPPQFGLLLMAKKRMEIEMILTKYAAQAAVEDVADARCRRAIRIDDYKARSLLIKIE